MSRFASLWICLLSVVLIPSLLVFYEYTRSGPAVFKSLPDHGVHVEAAANGNGDYISDWSWARVLVRWDEIELQPGKYTWSAVLDEDIQVLQRAKAPILLTIITTPGWARQFPPVRCSPPMRDFLDEYANFVLAVIDRYNPHAVELANEPEVTPDEIGDLDAWMGCWGPDGIYYAEMLKTVYPIIKAHHPGLEVVAGGLMLDDARLEFWKDVLDMGAGGYYDVVSFHGYIYYPLNDYSLIRNKADYLRNLGESSPLWLTETSMLCYDEYVECGQDFFNAQADYFGYISDHYRDLDLDKFFWFTLANNDWRHSDLVENKQLKPAWYLYMSYSTELGRRWNRVK